MPHISRQEFLRLAALGAAGGVLAMCVPKPGVLEKDIPTATVVDPTVTPGGETTSNLSLELAEP